MVIIGAGIAGLSAAITLAKQNIGSVLVSPQPSERAQSVLAEGGINAALDVMGEGDSAAEHFADTMRGGAYLADPNAVAGLTEHAPELVRWLGAIGVPFQMDGDRLVQRNFGGQKKKRTAYARSSTGKAVMTALIDEARKYEAAGLIRRFPHHELLRLELSGGACRGALVRDCRTGELFRHGGAVILATGGMNGLFPRRTTGATQNTGNAPAALFAQGVELANLEMIQYHPTTVQLPDKRLLVSEAARGEGGRLFVLRDGERRYFMEEVSEMGNLAPRDVISREMARIGGQAYLDLTGLPKETWKRKLPDLREELKHYLNLDPAKQPAPVSPGIHFFMGGVYVDEGHRANIPGLFAAGECACQYHGANRLGGNSLLGALYGGAVAARSAAETDAAGAEPERVGTGAEERETPAFSERLGAILYAALGILRDEAGMTAALEEVDSLAPEARTETDRRRLTLGRAMLLSALARRESRGAHTRTDFPARDDEQYQKTTVAVCRDGEISVSFRPIPERRGHAEAET